MNNFDFFELEPEQFGQLPDYPSRQFWAAFHRDLKGVSQNPRPSERSQQRQQAHKKPPSVAAHKTKTWWAILGVQPNDSKNTIKVAYRRLAKKYHPDSGNMPDGEANEKMRSLNLAYETAKKCFAKQS